MKLLMFLTPMLAIPLQSGLSSAMSFDSASTASSSDDQGVLTVTRGPQSTNFNNIFSIQPVIMPSSEVGGRSIASAVGVSPVSAPTQTSTTTSAWLSHTGGSAVTQSPHSINAGHGVSVPGAHLLRDLWGSKTSTADDAIPAVGEAYAPAVKVAESNEAKDPQSSVTSTCHTPSTHTAVPAANVKRAYPLNPLPLSSVAAAQLKVFFLLIFLTGFWTALFLFFLPQPTMAAAIPPAPPAPLESTKDLSERSQGGGDRFDNSVSQSLKLCSSLSVAIILFWVVHFMLTLPQGAVAESTSTLGAVQHKGGAGGAGAHAGGGEGAVVGGAHSGGRHGGGGSSCAPAQIKVQSILLLLIQAALAAFWVSYAFRQRPGPAIGPGDGHARSGNDAQT